MARCAKHDWYGSSGGTHGVPVPPCPWCMQNKLRKRIAELEAENQRPREALEYIEKNTGQRFIEQAAQRALLGGGE